MENGWFKKGMEQFWEVCGENTKMTSAILAAACFVAGWLVPDPWGNSEDSNELEEIAEGGETMKQEVPVDTILTYPDGSVYKGSFMVSSNTREGYGRLTFKDGKSYCEGEWKSDVLEYGEKATTSSTYLGHLDTNQRNNGYGISTYSDSYVKGKREQGKPDSQIIKSYSGNWKEDMKSGIGFAVMADGSMTFGNYTSGKLDSVPGKQFTVGDKVYGLDLSHHQSRVDWDNLAVYCDANGIRSNKKSAFMQPVFFAYVKATEGSTYQDNMYDKHLSDAKKHGVVVGSYHFYRMANPVESQVKNFLDMAKYTEGDLPPVLDVEGKPGDIEQYGSDKFQKEVLDWLDRIEKELHVRPIIYTRDDIKERFLTDSRFIKYDFWMARYNNAGPDYQQWRFWQQTESGWIKGCNRTVDINVFNGSYKDFQQYLKR